MVLKIIGIAESTYYYQKSPARQAEDTVVDAHIGRPILGYSLDQSSKRVSDEQIKEWLIEFILGEEGGYDKSFCICCGKEDYLHSV